MNLAVRLVECRLNDCWFLGAVLPCCIRDLRLFTLFSWWRELESEKRRLRHLSLRRVHLTLSSAFCFVGISRSRSRTTRNVFWNRVNKKNLLMDYYKWNLLICWKEKLLKSSIERVKIECKSKNGKVVTFSVLLRRRNEVHNQLVIFAIDFLYRWINKFQGFSRCEKTAKIKWITRRSFYRIFCCSLGEKDGRMAKNFNFRHQNVPRKRKMTFCDLPSCTCVNFSSIFFVALDVIIVSLSAVNDSTRKRLNFSANKYYSEADNDYR